MSKPLWLLAISALALPTGGMAKDEARAPQLQRLVDCKALAEPTTRLACYDREVAALDSAERSRDLVVVEKEQVRKARRTLFGLPLPRIDLLAGEREGDELREITGKIAAARQNAQGWRISLDDGSTWQQTDDKPMFRDPKPGDTATVSRGTLGSFFLKVGNIPPVKVKRIV